MIPLSPHNLATLHRVSQLHAATPDVLSRFEVDVLYDLVERSGRMGALAEASQAEWQIVGQALLALEARAPAPA